MYHRAKFGPSALNSVAINAQRRTPRIAECWATAILGRGCGWPLRTIPYYLILAEQSAGFLEYRYKVTETV